MLDPMMADEVAVKTIPRQKFSGYKQIFAFTEFQGVFLVRRLHFLGQLLNVMYHVFWILQAIVEENAETIVMRIILYPILFLYTACFIRVAAELAISVLLAPSLLAKPAAGGASSSNGGADADLAAYGVGVSGTDGTIV